MCNTWETFFGVQGIAELPSIRANVNLEIIWFKLIDVFGQLSSNFKYKFFHIITCHSVHFYVFEWKIHRHCDIYQCHIQSIWIWNTCLHIFISKIKLFDQDTSMLAFFLLLILIAFHSGNCDAWNQLYKILFAAFQGFKTLITFSELIFSNR